MDSLLRDLEFEDDNGGSGKIDILLDGKVKNNDGSSLVAINSKFGWLVNGPVPRLYSETGFTKSACRLLMYCVCKVFLRQKLSRLSRLKKFVGICGDEVSIYEKHASEIEFKKG